MSATPKASASWRTDKRKTAERGYGSKWQTAREHFLWRNPLCRMCEGDGRIELATVVDHIKKHEGDLKLFWNRNNWQPLCKRHHDGDKQVIDKGGVPKARIGLDGWPVGE